MKSFVALFLSIFVLISCSTNSEKDSDTPTLEFPLKVGNTWVFDIQGERSNRLDTLTVTKDTLIDGQTWFYLSEEEKNSHSLLNSSFQGYYTTYNSGLYHYSGESNISDNTPIFQANLTEGDTYLNDPGSVWITTYNGEESDSKYGSTYSYSVEYLTLLHNSTTFDLDQSYIFERVYSPEIGFVHWETAYLTSPRKDTTITLTLSERINIHLNEFIKAE
ncbi:MAG TPA: hypothetical protein DD671_02300 [Balneolaceae bacterium]|nr:hypothetical protein [Balneolaceae bacterium]